MKLESLLVTVLHSVDCTAMEGVPGKFDVIYYNFPHAGRPEMLKSLKGGDGHPWVKWRHNNLMAFFFRDSRTVLSERGRVCVATGQKSHCCSGSDLASLAVFEVRETSR